LAGCGASPTSDTSPSKSAHSKNTVATISVALSGTSAVGEKQWRAAFAQFEHDTPNVKVDPVFVNANSWVDFFSALETRITGGLPVDAADIPTEGQRLFASRGILAPLDSYIADNKASVDELYADIDPIMLKGFNAHSATYNKKTYYLPAWFNTTLILYSKKLFTDAKVAFPTPSWTWSDFMKTAHSLSDPTKHRYAMQLNIDVWGGFEPWVTTAGGTLLNSAWSAPTINSPATVEAFRFCRELVKNGLAPLPSPTANAMELMSSGNICMFNAAATSESSLADYGMSLDEVAFVTYPIKARRGASIGIGTFGMFESSKNKDAVWQLIQWITNKKQQDLGSGGSLSNGQLPIRTSASTSSAVLNQMPANSDLFWKILPYSQFVPGTNNASAMEGEMDIEWTSLLSGQVSPAACAQQMASTISKYL
jgi:multiple sugar transport system substrate-binding protein